MDFCKQDIYLIGELQHWVAHDRETAGTALTEISDVGVQQV